MKNKTKRISDSRKFTVDVSDSGKFTVNIQDCRNFTVNVSDCKNYSINEQDGSVGKRGNGKGVTENEDQGIEQQKGKQARHGDAHL